MPGINFKIDFKNFKSMLNSLDPRIVSKAAVLATNDMAKQARTQGIKTIRQEFNIKKKRLSKKIKIEQKATRNKIAARLSGIGVGIPMFDFAARQPGVKISAGTAKRIPGKKLGPATAKIKKKGGRRKIMTTPGAFIAQTPQGRAMVFRRKTQDSRSKLIGIFGPGASVMFGFERVQRRLRRFIFTKFDLLVFRKLDFLLSKRK